MTKSDWINQIAARTGHSQRDTQAVIDAAMDELRNALGRGDMLRLPQFGSFTVQETRARTGRNPQTGQPMKIKAGKRVSFKAAEALKAALVKKRRAPAAAKAKVPKAKATPVKAPAKRRAAKA